ncbi:MAG: prefoldin subunit alpha [Candidatus Woesearchaeota archaeon]
MADPQEENRKKLQQKYVEHQMLEQQLKQMQHQLEKLESQMQEVATVEKSVAELSAAKEGDDILVPVSGGIFFKAKVTDASRFLVNVGAGVVVSKNMEDTIALLKEQTHEIDRYRELVSKQLIQYIEAHQQLENDIKSIM